MVITWNGIVIEAREREGDKDYVKINISGQSCYAITTNGHQRVHVLPYELHRPMPMQTIGNLQRLLDGLPEFKARLLI